MTPGDPRHGTEAGHSSHKRDGEPPCEPCRHAKARADKRRRVIGPNLTPIPDAARRIVAAYGEDALHQMTGVARASIRHIKRTNGTGRARPQTIQRILAAGMPPTHVGLQRRLRALARNGWSTPAIVNLYGGNASHLCKVRNGEDFTCRPTTAALIVRAYNDLHMKFPPPSRSTNQVAARARNRGWVSSFAWDDIDTDAHPQGVDHPRKRGIYPDRLDDAVVERVLAGDWRLPTSRREKEEICRRYIEAGGSSYRLGKLTGLKVERYYRIGDAA